MRWRQVKQPDGSHKMVPVDEAAAKRDGVSLHTAFEPFKSPIDGTIISDRKAYREHCQKHNVVPTAEFSDEFLARKRKERERLYKGEHTTAETFARKQEIYETIMRAERNGR